MANEQADWPDPVVRLCVRVALLTWGLGCTAAGVGAALLWLDHASYGWIAFGVLVGLSGGATHAALLWGPRFRRQPLIAQAVILWMVASVACLLLLGILAAASCLCAPSAPMVVMDGIPLLVGLVAIAVSVPALLSTLVVGGIAHWLR